jgi:sn-glycerol 3-phosphate transport system substrate-binding protein
MTENGFKINWDDFVQPVLSYYRDSNKKLMSMPFNSSTAIVFYNKDLFKKANIAQAPKTWQELYKDIDLLVKSGAQCGLVSGWQSWILIENFSAIQNMPLASLNNGYDGNNPDLKFNNPTVVKNIETLQDLMKTKGFGYEGRRSDPARNAFVSGKCAIYFDSSSNIQQVAAEAKFSWATAQLPYLEGTQPKNSIIGGATLWAFKGHSKEENKATAGFINFLSKTESQIAWHKATGYLPITMTAYKKLKSEGYYKQAPEQETALLQLTRSATTPNSRGIRLGGFTQIREIIEEELEKVWSGKSNAKTALDSAVERGNRVIQNFSKTVK